MTQAEERALWDAYRQNQDSDAREQLIVKHMGLAKYIAGRIKMRAPAHVDEDDLIGWGMLGLIDAVEKYDAGRDLQFTTYASIRIRGAILDNLRAMDWAPRSLRAKARKLEQAQNALREELGRAPNEAELAETLGMTPDDVFTLVSDIHGAYVVSLDNVIPGETGDEVTTRGALTADRTAISPRDAARHQEVIERLTDAVMALAPQERHIIMLYYEEELTLKEIGTLLELSESRICQIHRKVMRGLKELVGQ